MRLSRCTPIFFAVVFSGLSLKGFSNTEFSDHVSGHIKYQWLGSGYAKDSVLYSIMGDESFDQAGDIRLKLDWKKQPWRIKTDYQIMSQYGEMVEGNRKQSISSDETISSINDDARLMDLTWNIGSQSGREKTLHRFDRVHLSYTGDKTVIRVDRQAVSWGNGLMYNPLDFLNPFDPAAVDKEYKTGDDMLYGQYLLNNGSDVQALWVGRRDPVSHQVKSEVASSAIKYHGFLGEHEWDLLIAQHYDDWVLGVGGISYLGDALWRGDIMLTDTVEETVFSTVTNLTWSWVGCGKNINASIEYFYNGFGEDRNRYGNNSELLKRIQRGELFTLGKQYLAGTGTIELNPLLTFTPSVYLNLEDGSMLTQWSAGYNLSQNSQVLFSLSVPIGQKGTEFGGLESSTSGKYLNSHYSFFAQIAWYF